MSIKIIPHEQLEQQDNKTSVFNKIPLIFYPHPATLYTKRVERMQFLAKESPFADYLQFCMKIVSAQVKLIENNSITVDLSQIVKSAMEKNCPPLAADNYPLTKQWLNYIYPIMDAAKNINESITETINTLKQNNEDELLSKAEQLLTGQFESIASNEALFIWSALSVYYSQLASQLPGKAVAQLGEQRWLCPVCQSSPVGSVVHIGGQLGLRYLHCSLCESEWYVPRAKCTNCDEMEHISYYSLDDELSAVKAECCEHCYSYLKVFNQERDAHLDIVADDINSLILDMETEKEGFAKSGVNPFLFSAQ